ncbi:MAG: hypothetical protein WBB34_15755, partial [Xanthobacteraceae bacterium]
PERIVATVKLEIEQDIYRVVDCVIRDFRLQLARRRRDSKARQNRRSSGNSNHCHHPRRRMIQ